MYLHMTFEESEGPLTLLYVTQILKGSHKLGRIEHKRVGGQTGADMERVDMVKKVHELLNRVFVCVW